MPPPPVSSPAGGTSWAVIGGVIVVLLVVVGAVAIFAGGSNSKDTAVPVSMPTGPGQGDIAFGATTGTGAQFISDIDEFCDGYQYFHDFQAGFETKLTAAKSMATFGGWYDDNDGFGAAGLGRMQSSFSPTSSVPLKSLRTYLAVLDDVARMKSVSEAKTELISQTPSFKREIAAVDKVARTHC